MERTKASIDLAICLRLIKQLRYGDAVKAFDKSLDKLIAAKKPPRSVDLLNDLKKFASALQESFARSFSTGKTQTGASHESLICSFCGKTQEEVKKLIAGPNAFICDECVDLCNDIMVEEVDGDSRDDAGEELAPEASRACALCGNLRGLDEVVFIPSLKQYFCETCVEAHFAAGKHD